MAFKRLAALWCLAAFLYGEVAQARGMILTPFYGAPISTDEQAGIYQIQRNTRLLEQILRATGNTTFYTMRGDRTSTEEVRSGKQRWNRGTAGEYVEQFDWVASMATPLGIKAFAGQARIDSLSRLAVQGSANRTNAAVPLLVFGSNHTWFFSGGGTGPWGSSGDSCGFTGSDAGPGKAIYSANSGRAFLTHAYVAGAKGGYATGDKRNILFGGIPQADYRVSNGTNAGATLGCRNCDSLMTYAATDTVVLWDRQYGSRLGQARTITYASAFGAGAAFDSLTTANSWPGQPPTEGDFAVMLAALAHLDSLVRADTNAAGVKRGGKVLGDKVIRIAPVVYGALARGERHAWKSPGSAQGILASDTSSFYAILDSIRTYNIPVTFAVNVDSASTYARDVIKLKEVSSARFTPQVWNGISDTTKAGGQDALYRPVDVFGRYRKRTAMGDGSGVGADTGSVYTLLKSARRMCDSLFAGRTSRIAVAPDDDWSPKNLLGADAGGLTIDSLLYAIQQAGFIGVVADAQDPDCNASKTGHGPSKTNPRGYYNRQGYYNSPRLGVKNFKVLTHTGYPIMGGRAQAVCPSDSSSTPALTVFTIYKEIARVWSGALLEFDDSYDTWPYDDISSPDFRNQDDILQRKVDRTQATVSRAVVHGNIMRLSCADLSGASGSGIVPAATMWHVMKSINTAMSTINQLAGRTVVTWSYPEDIEP